MIVSEKNTGGERQQSLRTFIFMGVLLLIAIILFSLSPNRNKAMFVDGSELVVAADAEDIDKENSVFIKDEYRVAGAQTRSDVRALSGRYSSKINAAQPYGFTYQIAQPEKGTHYKASVWEFRTGKTRGQLVVTADNAEVLYKTATLPSEKTPEGWELLNIYFTIPIDGIEFIKVFTYAADGSKDLYFDDFSIVKNPQYEGELNDAGTTNFSLHLPEKSFKKLKDKKDKAVQKGILITEESDWAKAYILEEGKAEVPVSVRLKGDYLDHVAQNKWSMRVKVKGENTWRKMKTFSIQSPHTRSFLSEWLYHKMLEERDVLTPRYQFVSVNIDNLKSGVYAIEEHFEKHLVEAKRRREGPIIKLAEEGFWLGYKRQTDFYGEDMLAERMDNAFWKSEIKPFKEAKTLASETLARQYEVAQNLLFNYKYQNNPASEIFDVEKLANLYAVMDVMDAYHGRAWHNQRFYYNPAISKLEPIGFDGYGERPQPLSFPFLGYYFDSQKEFIDFTLSPFLDAAFFKAYISALNELSNNEKLQLFLDKYNLELAANEARIQSEYPDYKFDTEPIYKKARKIQNLIHPYDEVSLQVRSRKIDEETQTLQLFNKHCLPLEVIGYGVKNNRLSGKTNLPVFVPSQIKGKITQPVELSIPSYAKFVFYQLPGVDSMHYSSISKWTGTATNFPLQSIKKNFDIANIPFAKVLGPDVIIPAGDHQLTQDLIINKDQQLIVQAGAHIDMSNQANIISYGPVTMQGTAETPIRISSSAKNGQSFTVLQAPVKSRLEYVIFSHLNTLNKAGWQLTGAVTFYESPVEINNCEIRDNHCEDALNIVRSHFEIERLTIHNSMSDGFDADFCSGKIMKSVFNNTGNDGMDFSGSNITIGSPKITNAGDKGISVGEASDVTVWNAVISKSNMGVASKDESKLTVHNINMSDCNIGYAAYQKKPEFGPAKIIVHGEKLTDIRFPNQIEAGSTLTIE